MNILHLGISDPATFGGAETHIRNLMRITEAVGCRSSARALPGVSDQVRPGPAETRLPLVGFAEALSRFLREARIDLVVSHNLHMAQSPGLGPRLATALRSAGVPHLANVHDVFVRDKQSAAWLEDAYCLTTSPFITAELLRLFGIRAVAQFAPVFDTRAAPFAEEPEPRTIAMPARLTGHKGSLQAVMLVGHVTGTLGPLRLLLSARTKASTPVSEAYVAQLQTAGNLFPELELAFNESPDVWSVYQRAAVVLAAPITPEGFGLTPAEALLRGRPVVAVPKGGMSWVKNWPGVIAIDGWDIVALAEAIAEMLENNAAWQAAALDGRAKLLARHDEGKIARDYRDLFQTLIERGPKPLTKSQSPAKARPSSSSDGP